MKKQVLWFVSMILVFGILFSVPANALDMFRFSKETAKKGGAFWVGEGSILHPGSVEYWRLRIMVEKSWDGANRPQPLMGDANIDGKVDAQDALFALYFGMYGNEQTHQLAQNIKTPYILRAEEDIYLDCYQGNIDKAVNSPEFWLTYCRMNSPFFADVTKDCVVNALDALLILKYSVGTAKHFPENDFSSLAPHYFLYYVWPTEYTLMFYEKEFVITPTDV